MSQARARAHGARPPVTPEDGRFRNCAPIPSTIDELIGNRIELAPFEQRAILGVPQGSGGPPKGGATQTGGAPCTGTSVCKPGFFIWGCDDRGPSPVSIATIAVKAPWKHAGKINSTFGSGSGVYIGPNHVLTCAHVVVDPSRTLLSNKAVYLPGFTLGACAFTPRWITQAAVPNEYIGGNSRKSRMYDWAVLTLDSIPSPDLTVPPPMKVAPISADIVNISKSFSIGYPGTLSKQLWSTTVGGKGAAVTGVEFDDGSAGGGLLLTTHDAEGGQSGSPVYLFDENLQRILVGLLVGAPNCSEGKNWASYITAATFARIQQIILNQPATNMTILELTGSKSPVPGPNKHPGCGGVGPDIPTTTKF